MDENDGRQLQTVRTAAEIIDGLRELNGAGVTELAEHLNLSKGSVHHHLSTLRSKHLVTKDDGIYRLGLHFVTFGEYVKNHNSLYRAGQDEIDRLAKDTGEFAHLMTEEFGRAIHLYKAQGENAVGKPYHIENLQRRDYLHYSAAGKAILSQLSEERIRSIVDTYGLPERTNQTITNSQELFDELETVRDRGCAFNDEEEITGLRAVAAPVNPNQDSIVGAISVSGPLSRMDGDRFTDELPEKVVRVANVIELNIDTANQ